GIYPVLPPQAGILVATEGSHETYRTVGVYPNGTSLQFLRHAHRSSDVAGPYCGCQPEPHIVRDGNRFSLVLKADDGKDGTENFFLGDAHIVRHIAEDGRLDKPAVAALWLIGGAPSKQKR